MSNNIFSLNMGLLRNSNPDLSPTVAADLAGCWFLKLLEVQGYWFSRISKICQEGNGENLKLKLSFH